MPSFKETYESIKDDWSKGEFQLLSPVEYLMETRDIITNLGDNVTSQVFNDHANNYCYIETPDIKEDKERFLTELNRLINDPIIKKQKAKNRIPR